MNGRIDELVGHGVIPVLDTGIPLDRDPRVKPEDDIRSRFRMTLTGPGNLYGE